MSGPKLSEIHQKLKDFGVTLDAMSKMTTKEAVNLLNYKNTQAKDSMDPDDLSAFYDLKVWDWDEDFEINITSKGVKHD